MCCRNGRTCCPYGYYCTRTSCVRWRNLDVPRVDKPWYLIRYFQIGMMMEDCIHSNITDCFDMSLEPKQVLNDLVNHWGCCLDWEVTGWIILHQRVQDVSLNCITVRASKEKIVCSQNVDRGTNDNMKPTGINNLFENVDIYLFSSSVTTKQHRYWDTPWASTDIFRIIFNILAFPCVCYIFLYKIPSYVSWNYKYYYLMITGLTNTMREIQQLWCSSTAMVLCT